MAYTTIDDPSAHFQTKLYTGNSTNNTAITNDGNSDLQPDLIWAKSRSNTHYHDWRDTSRGLTKRLASNDNGAESTKDQSYVSFDSDGFTLGDDTDGSGSALNTVNTSSNNYVAWQWKANGGTTSTNNDGSVAVTLQTNSTAGFSIGTFTGTGDSSGTIGHGLGAKPDWLVVKRRDGSENWNNIFANFDSKLLRLNTDGASFTGSAINSVGASTFTDGNGNNAVFYAFKSIQGYSKFGSYKGNGNADGRFVYTGFKPAWVMFKRFDSSNDWLIFDNKRNTSNITEKVIYADTSQAEQDDSQHSGSLDLLSNGFKMRETGNSGNGNGATYVYVAFAEHPFVSSKGVPVTAR